MTYFTALPDAKEASHLLSLQDASGNVLYFNPAGPGGQVTVTAIRRNPVSRTGVKTSTGPTKYGDFEPPYIPIAQDSWVGGRGADDLDEDATRYFDAGGINVSEDGIFLGGQPTYTTGYRSQDVAFPGSVAWQGLYGDQRYLSRSFTASASYDAVSVQHHIRKVGSPGALNVALYSYSGGGLPGASLASATLAAATITDTLSEQRGFTYSAAYSVASGTNYYVVIYGTSTDDATNHWEVATDNTASGYKSSNGTSWTATSDRGPYYRVLNSTSQFSALFFEYKRGMYFVYQPPEGTASTVYLNGDRGAADANTGALSTLVDATKAWTVNEWAGCKVLLTKGTGSEESVAWRTISSNTATALTVTPNWNVTHDTTTEYVILGSNKWQSWVNLVNYCTSVAACDDFVYFARGEDVAVRRYQEYNKAGVWTQRGDDDIINAVNLLAIRHPTEGQILWGSRNEHADHGVCVFKGRVPRSYGDLYTIVGELAPTNTPWDSSVIANVTQSTTEGNTKIAIAAGFTTGTAAVENLAAPIDISQGTRLGVEIKSDVACDAADMQLLFDDVPDLTDNIALTAAYSVAIATGAPTYTALTNAIDGQDDTYTSATVGAAGKLILIAPSRFNSITFDLGTAVNNNASALTAAYSSGGKFSALTVTDNTASPAGTPLAVDGTITFTVPQDWETGTINSVTGYIVTLTYASALDAVDFKRIYCTRSNNVTLSFPALIASEWKWATMNITPLEWPYPDDTAIQSVAFKVAVDKGAQNVVLKGGLQVLTEKVEYIELPQQSRITNMVAYSGNSDDPRENPWIITEDGIYEIQTQNSDAAVPIPLKEMAGLRSEENGLAAAVNDVYLYFNLGQNMERYFNRNLDDIGPNRDSGLPSNRQGTPRAIASYPGRVFLAIDGGENNYSSILVRQSDAWHEVYRAPSTGTYIRSIHVQAIPGSSTARLWICRGAAILWTPVSLNAWSDSDYRFMHEGYMESAWLYSNMQDIAKLWHSVKEFCENVTANRFIKLDYKIDGDTTWTEVTGQFDTEPVEEIDLSSASPPTVNGKRLRYRQRFYTNDNTESPRVKAVVVEAIASLPVKYSYQWTFELSDGDLDVDLDNRDNITSVVTKAAQLDSWAENNTPLLMRCRMNLYDNKNVTVDPMGVVPIKLDPQTAVGYGREVYFGQVTVNEL